MDEAESHMTSAAAFVEGGIQEACDDACSICLEGFCDSDPCTVTICKHEFHLQCVLECLLSSMAILRGLVGKVPEKLQLSNVLAKYQSARSHNQELLEAVEQERSFRFTPSRNARILHHPTLGDFELEHLPVGVNDAELEDRIIQHLAAAAAMGRTQRIARREGRIRSSAHARPQFVVYSPHPNDFSTGSGGDETEAAVLTEDDGSIQDMHPSNQDNNQISSTSSGSLVMPITGRGLSSGDKTLRVDLPCRIKKEQGRRSFILFQTLGNLDSVLYR
ncbi:E3 ubiquitin-protein ligase rhf2a [Orobanche gracilis]